ncbi:MAG: alcohol dehydrogenase catalytic domain-containing protein [Acetobacteraceae bacterium]
MLRARAAVLSRIGAPMTVETIEIGEIGPGDVLVRVRAASLCHTDVEAIDGALALRLPAVLGHEAAGEIAETGPGVDVSRRGERVVLSWNPHCGHCFYCERAQPILCATYLANGPTAFHFDTNPRLFCDGVPIHQLMYLGSFAEYCVVPAQCAVRVPDAMPFDRAALLGCAVMTGVGAATRIADLRFGAVAMVLGCGAVGLSAVQGCRLAGAGIILAIDPDPGRRELARTVGATHATIPDEAVALARALTGGRGADVVIEAAGRAEAFALSVEAARPGGQVVWLGKVAVGDPMTFRWGSLMQEKRIIRSSYGGAHPDQDFPLLAQAYLGGKLRLDEMISARIELAAINEAVGALRGGEIIRAVVIMGGHS